MVDYGNNGRMAYTKSFPFVGVSASSADPTNAIDSI